MVRAGGISDRQWRDIARAARWTGNPSDLIRSPRIPRDQWRQVLSGVAGVAGEHDGEEVAEAVDLLSDEVDAAEPVADPEGTNLSWLVNLTLMGQLTALYAALGVLEALGQWTVVTFTDDRCPPRSR